MSVVLFLLGVYLAIRVLAALHGVRDLWYTIGTAWPRVLGRLLLWTALIGAVAVTASPALRRAFLLGLAGYAVFYALHFPLFRLYVRSRLRVGARGSRAD